MAKKFSQASGLVYSTDPNFKLGGDEFENFEPVAPALQLIKIKLETKHRAGKAVSLVDGFVGTEAERIDLGKKLKAFCGTGGSVKDGEILVQGDHRDKMLQWFHKNGYGKAKRV